MARVTADHLGIDVADDIGHFELAVVNGDLRVQHDFAAAGRLVLRPAPAGRSAQSRPAPRRLPRSKLPQRMMRLLAIPGTALRRTQMRDNLLRRLEAGIRAHRRDEQRSHVADLLTAVHLVQRHLLDHCIYRTRRVNQLHGKIVGILVHQCQLDIRGDALVVHLPQQRGCVRVDGRVVHGRHTQRVNHLQAVQRVNLQQAQTRLDKTDAVDDLDRDACRPCLGQNARRRRFAHQRVAGDSVNHVALAGRVQQRVDIVAYTCSNAS